jgi:hypothetical protein
LTAVKIILYCCVCSLVTGGYLYLGGTTASMCLKDEIVCMKVTRLLVSWLRARKVDHVFNHTAVCSWDSGCWKIKILFCLYRHEMSL